jgi:hypothetical protein
MIRYILFTLKFNIFSALGCYSIKLISKLLSVELLKLKDSNFKSFDSSFIGKTPYAHDDHGLGFFFSNNKSFVTQFGSNLIEVYLRIENPEYIEYDEYVKAIGGGDSEYPTYNGDSLRKFLIKNGNDGIIVTGWNPRTEIICVFEPNQIKSIENDGTWDIGDDNIFS